MGLAAHVDSSGRGDAGAVVVGPEGRSLPSGVAPCDEALAIWKDYLRQQWLRHLVWLIVNGVIAPISVLFAILPGPNLIGYWFAYRAVHHSLVVWGIRRLRRNKIPTELHPIAALDLPVEMGKDGKYAHAALTGRATGLDMHMAWHGSPALHPPKANLPSCRRQTVWKPPNYRLRCLKTGDHAPSELQHS